MAKNIILDCDPGHDDAVAILLALAATDKLNVLGLTIVGGNVPLKLTTANALRVLKLADRTDVPVHAGCPRPLMRKMVTAEHVHGESGLDTGTGNLLPLPATGPADQHAVNYLIETIRSMPKRSITIAATGPLTNIAAAIAMAPEIMVRLESIVIMGGANHEPGNITPAAEFNIYVDPHAAKSVFDSGIKLTIFGLDITHKMLITPSRLKAISAHGGRVGEMVADFLEFFNRYDIEKYGWNGAPLHDPCTIAYLIDPSLFSGHMMAIDVDTTEGLNLGRTVADWYGVTPRPANALVITDGDSDRFFDLIVKHLAKL